MTTMTLSLDGLRAEGAQVWGGVRLVPLIRETVSGNLRMGLRAYDDPFGPVAVEGPPPSPEALYTSFLPHGLVMAWGPDGEPVTLTESVLSKTAERRPHQALVRLHRTVKREAARRFRLLPLHVALESLLALHFGGPDVARRFWSGNPLGSRSESGVAGWNLPDLGPALQLFEIHRDQCGLIVFVDDVLASAFVTSHPDDYRQMHATLLLDLYGETLWHHGHALRDVPAFDVAIDAEAVNDLDDLAAAVAEARAEWASFAIDEMAGGLFGRDVTALHQRPLGPFRLSTFLTGSDPDREQHLGEVLRDREGRVQYLKTFQLSRETLRRVQLLETLAAHDWDPAASAEALGQTVPQLANRLAANGFGDWVSREAWDALRG